MDKYKIKDYTERLKKETYENAQKMIYMWIKQEVISLNEYRTLVKNIEVVHCCKSDSEQLPDVYLQELSKVEWIQQTQTDLNSQLRILRQFANKLGLYDASDYLKK